jgi:hypothetical protein
MAAPRQVQGLQFLRVGLPLITLTVGGWLALSAFVGGRLDVEVRPRHCVTQVSVSGPRSHLQQSRSCIQDARRTVPDERAPAHKQRAKLFNVQEELARLRPEENFVNKPIPRPPDES